MNLEQKLYVAGVTLTVCVGSVSLFALMLLPLYNRPNAPSSLVDQTMCTPTGEAFVIKNAREEDYYDNIKVVMARTPQKDAQCTGVALYRVK